VAGTINALQKFNSEHIEQLQFAMTNDFGAPLKIHRASSAKHLTAISATLVEIVFDDVNMICSFLFTAGGIVSRTRL
jgi:hypothetical protein